MASLASRANRNPLPPTATAKAEFTKPPTADDPYSYTTGFGNRFISQALPGVISWSQNTPQKVKYDLYSEQLNGSAVNAKRNDIRHVWMYRIRPSVAHGPIRLDPSINQHVRSTLYTRNVSASIDTDTSSCPNQIESSFLSPNPNVESCASQQAWDPFPIPEAKTASGDAQPINFVQGIRTIGGKGDASLQEGLAVHTYSANSSMDREAFCNNDGEMLILPQQGRLDIMTELGPLMVRPGEVFLMPSGMCFSVRLPDGPSRGYIHEVFAAHHDIPERGVIGPNGMSMERNFCAPLARYDIDENVWSIIHKLDGALHKCGQRHTPFDVVAWHGNHVPIKYDLNEFVSLVNSTKDQADPTLYTVLSVPSNKRDTPLSEFMIFTEKWITAEGTFRPPYYHRNMSTEIMGLVFGEYGGSSHALAPGGLSYEAAYMPHGETYETWQAASQRELEPVKICTGTMAFMFHIGGPLKLTKWAMHGQGAKSLHPSDPSQWDGVRPGFFDHAEQIAADIAAENEW